MFLHCRSVPNVDFGASYEVSRTFCVILIGFHMILYNFTWFWIGFEGKSMENYENAMKIPENSIQIARNRCMPV